MDCRDECFEECVAKAEQWDARGEVLHACARNCVQAHLHVVCQVFLQSRPRVANLRRVEYWCFRRKVIVFANGLVDGDSDFFHRNLSEI